jgi:tRNA nucleotidyltransferase (CCA-adding enzyme)
MRTVLTTHKNMDLDGLGALVGLKKLYPDAEVVLPDTKGEDVLTVLRENPDVLEFTEESSFKGGEIDRLIVVDTDSFERIPESVKGAVTERTEIVVFDHHSKSFELPAKVFFKETGSTSSIVTLLLKGKGVVPSPYDASLLLLGIYSDTGSFRYPSTTPMDFLAAAYLLSVGAELSFVKRYLPKELSPEELDILKVMKDNLTLLNVHGNRIGLTYGRFDRYVGEVSHLVSKLLEIRDLPALFGVFEVQGTTFLIGRSQSERIDVSKVVEPFGGGGHSEAASASIKGKTVFEILDKLKEVLFEKVEPLVKAKDIMTSPPIVISEGLSVSEGRMVLMKNSINAAPVVDSEGKIVGIVARSLLDKAVYMGLNEEKVSNVAERDFYSVSPETSIREVEEIIVEKHQSFVPVVVSGKPVGVITRTDLLVNSYRDEINELSNFYRKRVSSPPRFRNVGELIKKVLPKETFNLLREIGKVADREGVNAYIVGGFVRDLIIGRENFDIDIVVEGDATEFAKVVGRELGAKVHTFSRFKTATLVFKDGTRIDMASARTEVYKFPGALPEVDIAPLKKDLFRRDFTINTLSVKINYSDFGKLIDFFGGLKDIKDRKIRVLHSLSFVEDPTRILRALRFSVRYRFELGRHTEKLLRMAVEKKLFKTVEGQRIYHELKQILLEDNPLRVFLRLEKYKLIEELFPGLRWNREKKDTFERVRKLIIWHRINFPEKKTDYHLVYLGALFFKEPLDRVKNYLSSLSFPEKEGKKLLKFLYEIYGTYRALKSSNLPSEVYKTLRRKEEEFLLLLAALFPDVEEKVVNFMRDWRFVEPLVSGKDIKELGLKPGPAFKEILNRIKYEIIDGRVSREDREEQYSRLKEMVVGKVSPSS